MKRILLVLGVMGGLTGVAQAKDWHVDYAHSRLSFVGDQNGEKFTGGFKKFEAKIALDPDHVEMGSISVIVDTASAYAGSPDRDQMLPQKDWFDTSKFPQAQFVSTSLRKIGADQYEAAATLTIKGITHAVTLPFTLVPEGEHWRAQGHVLLVRSDFAVGQGQFAGETYVKLPVDVRIDLVAN